MQRKSIVLAVILATFFGPLGLIYASVVGAVLLTTAAAILGLLTPFAIGSLFVLPFSAIWSIIAVLRHNKRARREGKRIRTLENRVAELSEETQELQTLVPAISSPSGNERLSLKEQAEKLRRG
jgi:putative Ca2+/H+ antiporter (TMEM165/GDT1 family)